MSPQVPPASEMPLGQVALLVHCRFPIGQIMITIGFRFMPPTLKVPLSQPDKIWKYSIKST